MSEALKPGDRIRVRMAGRTADYEPGDKGTVLRVGLRGTTGAPYYTVAMDRDGPTATGVVLEAGEVEPDV